MKKVKREILTKAIAGLTLIGGVGTVAGRTLIGAVAPKLVPTTPLGIIGATTGTGILVSSPTVRRVAGEFLRDPIKTGIAGGVIIEKAVAGKEVPGVIEGLVTAGIVGAGVGGFIGAKKILKDIKTPVVKDPSSVPSSIALPSSAIPDSLSPISDAPVVATTPEPVSLQVPEVNVKVINKPQINVAMAQSI